MSGVTNAPFRMLCRRFGAGLYVSEMIQARALVERNDRTMRMARFAPGESPRSIQLYGSDPVITSDAVKALVNDHGAEHIDFNFGCPMPKVTRNGGGSAVPAKPKLLRNIVRAAVGAAGEVPITLKFRVGLTDNLTTFLDTGRIAEEEGASAIALHARTTEQLYSGRADWRRIAELKSAVSSIPVLGNGDIWEAGDALAMMRETGCDGVVIGRGCLGRPWLFAELAAAFAGTTAPVPPRLGEVLGLMREHAELLVEHFEGDKGVREFRKHTSWYLTGFPVGGEVRRRLNQFADMAELDEILNSLDPDLELPAGAGRIARGHTHGPRQVVLPDGYLDHLDDDVPPGPGADLEVSGG